MTRARKPKGDRFDRQLSALVKLRKTKLGREIVDNHRQAIVGCLAEGVGKP